MEQLHQTLAEIRAMAEEGLLDAVEVQEMKREAMAAHRDGQRAASERGAEEREREREAARIALEGARLLHVASAQAARDGLVAPRYGPGGELMGFAPWVENFGPEIPFTETCRSALHTFLEGCVPEHTLHPLS